MSVCDFTDCNRTAWYRIRASGRELRFCKHHKNAAKVLQSGANLAIEKRRVANDVDWKDFSAQQIRRDKIHKFERSRRKAHG